MRAILYELSARLNTRNWSSDSIFWDDLKKRDRYAEVFCSHEREIFESYWGFEGEKGKLNVEQTGVGEYVVWLDSDDSNDLHIPTGDELAERVLDAGINEQDLSLISGIPYIYISLVLSGAVRVKKHIALLFDLVLNGK